MKKILKIIGILILFIVLIVGATLTYISFADIPSYETQEIKLTIQSDSLKIARGKKLASMLCVNCHYNSETKGLTGKQMKDAPEEFGVIFSANITQDKQFGIGDWTDGEILYLLRTGIKKNGQYAPPYMAKLPTMADDDIEAIIAFLRSDDNLVAAQNVADKACEPSFLTKLLCRIAFKPFDLPNEKIPTPDTANSIALGKYLAHNLECYSCHSADFKTNNFLEPTLSQGYFGGGNKPLDEKGRVLTTPNLTPDAETGIGNWNKDKFIKAVKFGIVEGDMALRYPMVPYPQLTDAEAGAIYDYLKTIPAIKNKIERPKFDAE